MSYIDNLVASKYDAQSDKDIERYAGDHSNLHNNDFTNSLYNFLRTKYFWRDWMVLQHTSQYLCQIVRHIY
jgi:hypothetical protein